MMIFADVHPSLDNYWRAIILFGRNVASYKFALGQTLLEMAQKGQQFVPLTELAQPFARHIAEHLKLADKQATSQSSRFLNSCRKFNRGEMSETELTDLTVRLGFNNVIDASHVVSNGELGVRFFADERATAGKGIRYPFTGQNLPGLPAGRAVEELSTARSGTMPWTGQGSQQLSRCFEVNFASIRRVKNPFTVHPQLEEALNVQFGTLQNWPHLPDGVVPESAVITLCGGH